MGSLGAQNIGALGVHDMGGQKEDKSIDMACPPLKYWEFQVTGSLNVETNANALRHGLRHVCCLFGVCPNAIMKVEHTVPCGSDICPS